MKSSPQRCSPRSCPECSNTPCIMCCHVTPLCVSSAAFEALLGHFAIGIKPKYSNVVVRPPGESKGDNMVWGLEHRTWNQFRGQSCILVIQGVFWAQSIIGLCSRSVLCHHDLGAWWHSAHLQVFGGMLAVGDGRWCRAIPFCILHVH